MAKLGSWFLWRLPRYRWQYSLQQEFQRLRAGSSDEEVVKSENEKAAIEAKAKQVAGVRSVNNLLEVEANQ